MILFIINVKLDDIVSASFYLYDHLDTIITSTCLGRSEEKNTNIENRYNLLCGLFK